MLEDSGNLAGRAEFEIERNKKISKVQYIACPVEFPKGDALRIPPGKSSILESAI